MNILLHICCAPCSIHPIDVLKKEGHRFAGYFYNPNIHPYTEYLKRKTEVEKYSKEAGINTVFSDYEMEKFFQYVTYNEAKGTRCPICWWRRAERTALFAKENGFDAFTTTLLGSPYQEHDVVKTIFEDVAKSMGIEFYYKDFRAGFRDGQTRAREMGMYIQNYCGCLFSEKERLDERDAKKVKKS